MSAFQCFLAAEVIHEGFDELLMKRSLEKEMSPNVENEKKPKGSISLNKSLSMKHSKWGYVAGLQLISCSVFLIQ